MLMKCFTDKIELSDWALNLLLQWQMLISDTLLCLISSRSLYSQNCHCLRQITLPVAIAMSGIRDLAEGGGHVLLHLPVQAQMPHLLPRLLSDTGVVGRMLSDQRVWGAAFWAGPLLSGAAKRTGSTLVFYHMAHTAPIFHKKIRPVRLYLVSLLPSSH